MLPTLLEKELAAIEKFFSPPFFTQTDSFPRTDIYIDTDESLVFEFAVAGYKREEMFITFEDGKLFIQGKKDNQGDDKKKFIQHKISHRNFEVVYIIPIKYNGSNPDAIYEDGILTIKFKKSKQVERKQITIN